MLAAGATAEAARASGSVSGGGNGGGGAARSGGSQRRRLRAGPASVGGSASADGIFKDHTSGLPELTGKARRRHNGNGGGGGGADIGTRAVAVRSEPRGESGAIDDPVVWNGARGGRRCGATPLCAVTSVRTGLAAALVCGLAWLYADVGGEPRAPVGTSPDASYGAILAAVALVLFWQRRHAIVARGRTPGARGRRARRPARRCASACWATWQASSPPTFSPRARRSCSWPAAWSGFSPERSAAAATLAPLLFLLLAIPLPELVVTSLTSSLQTVAARTAEVTLSTAGIPVYRDGNVLMLPATTLQIVEACSGLRSVVSLASIGILLVWATPGSGPRRAILLISTIPLAVVANGLRVAATGAAAEAWGPAMTRDPWHTLAGWLTFVVSLLALWIVRYALLPRRCRRRPSRTPLEAHT